MRKHYTRVSVGTFAVVSLMVGSTVDKYCYAGDGGEDGVVTTMSPISTTFGWGNVTGNYTDDLLKDCKVEVATALTFLGGILQVTFVHLFCNFILVFYWYLRFNIETLIITVVDKFKELFTKNTK